MLSCIYNQIIVLSVQMNKLVKARMVLITEEIRRKRKYLNYSQQDMGRHLGISQNAYSKLETGYTKMSVFQLFQIAELLALELTPYVTKIAG